MPPHPKKGQGCARSLICWSNLDKGSPGQNLKRYQFGFPHFWTFFSFFSSRNWEKVPHAPTSTHSCLLAPLSLLPGLAFPAWAPGPGIRRKKNEKKKHTCLQGLRDEPPLPMDQDPNPLFSLVLLRPNNNWRAMVTDGDRRNITKYWEVGGVCTNFF